MSIDKYKNVLIIGSNGFLGRHFAKVFEHVDGLYVADIQSESVYKHGTYIQTNIVRPEQTKSLFSLSKFDLVINCAGIASPKKYIQKQKETLDVSYIGTQNVLNECAKQDVRCVLFSSSEIYGQSDQLPYKESGYSCLWTNSDRSCYDIGKQCVETLAYVYRDEVNSIVFRPFNIYGPGIDLHDGRVIPNILKSKINNTNFQVYGDGNQTRSYCFVFDAMNYMVDAINRHEVSGIYNIGNDKEEVSVKELAQIAAKTLGINYTVLDHYPSIYPQDEPRRRVPDLSKIQELVGRQQQTTSLKKGLMLTYESLDTANESACSPQYWG